ncbi:MAG: hypothetical protein LBF42_01835 [Puniceicoccales bacterium]|jgi:hypothetical protein|nr:hypothetical protein [Puniceicoccales bacterium]
MENKLEEVSENLENAEHKKEIPESKLVKANRLIEDARHRARMQTV